MISQLRRYKACSVVVMHPPRLLLCLVLLTLRPALGAEQTDLLLAAANDAELQPLIARLASPRTATRAAWTFWLGTLDGKSVALTRTEGDPLNAVAATTLAIRRYHPRLVVTYGLARPHDPALHPGDIVISDKFTVFDGFISVPAKPGQGSNSLSWNPQPYELMSAGEKETPAPDFPADRSALALALTLHPARGRIVVGVLGSASQINREADRIAWLRQHWGTRCEDGESAHIAGCAELLGVPAFGLRIIDGTDAEAAALALQFVKAWK